MKVIFAGCGFLGEAAADLFSGLGWEVLALCASRESADRLKHKPFEVLAGDIATTPGFSGAWSSPDLLVHCASSGRGGGVDAYQRVYVQGMRQLLAATNPHHVLFVGSTSVYGQTDGSFVDETSPAAPAVETGQILLEAESLALAAGGCVLRLSGIYGPGRSVLLRKYRDGTATLDGDGTRWVNQVHRDDAARAILHAGTKKLSGIFNVSDDTPAQQREVYSWIASPWNGPLPPATERPGIRKRGSTNKRVSNAKLKATGWQPSYPCYKDALPGLVLTTGIPASPENRK
ncbi:MAG: NAD-dependent epimerase/dehydratase family protein [Terrimicrobiaceae bacterium]